MADGYICRRGGANILNVFVKAYATEAELLADAPKENTIGVVTRTGITKFSIQPTTPPGGATGNVWIIDKSSTWRSPYIQVISPKKVSPNTYVAVFPQGCMQYESDALVLKTAYLYQSGAWTKFSAAYTYAYKDGTTDLTWSGRGTDTSSALVMTTKKESFSGSYRSGGWKGSTGKMTVPYGASKLRMKYSVSVSTGSFSDLSVTAFGLRSTALSAYENGNTNFTAYAALTSGSTVFAMVPITSDMWGKSYYIGFHANTGSNNTEVVSKWTVNRIWFE